MNAPRVLCITEKQLSSFVENVIAGGGEGAILREPRSLYLHGRTPFLVKVKVSISLDLSFAPECSSTLFIRIDMLCRLHGMTKKRLLWVLKAIEAYN